jgi:outer membrane receptor for ferrienterochelin and colicin
MKRLRARLSGLGLCAGAALAPALIHAAEPVPAQQRIEVKGSVEVVDDARDAVAARLIVSRQEIERMGDTSVTEVLRRVPGITVSGAQGRAGEVRMRGLGSGYTQILINGELVAPGFTLDSLSPAQIERIEVARVATVDQGAQAIAGTINFVLKQAPRKAQRELKASTASEAGRPSVAVDGLYGDRAGTLSYALGLGLSARRDAPSERVRKLGTDAAGVPDLDRSGFRTSAGSEKSASLTPKLTWQPSVRDKLLFDALLRRTILHDTLRDERTVALGDDPLYFSDTLARRFKITLAQTRLNWTHRLDNEATLELRVASSDLRRDSDNRLLGRDAATVLVMDELIDTDVTEHAYTVAGKLRLPYAKGHAVALGWDGERSRRGEDRLQRQTSPTGRPTLDLDETFVARVTRVALYAQDEWDLSDALSVYAGVRWAGLRTLTDGTRNGVADFATVASRSGVTSPVLQALWKLNEARGEQLRLALSRSYRAPRARDLLPRRIASLDNQPTSPDIEGNPGLRPELAWGLDLAYERFLARDAGLFSVSLGARRIDDVIVDRLFREGAGGPWVTTKANGGRAEVYALDIESRLRARALWADAPDLQLRANVSRNWSRVAAVPGPNNRLDSQIPFSANLGLDWRLAVAPVTLGANFGFQGGVDARSTPTESTTSSARRTLDLYALWRQGTVLQWRLAIANALHQNQRSVDTHTDADGGFTQVSDTPTHTTIRLTMEMRL